MKWKRMLYIKWSKSLWNHYGKWYVPYSKKLVKNLKNCNQFTKVFFCEYSCMKHVIVQFVMNIIDMKQGVKMSVQSKAFK